MSYGISLVFQVSCPSCVLSQPLVHPLAGVAEALVLCKYSSAIAKTLVCYQHSFGCQCKTQHDRKLTLSQPNPVQSLPLIPCHFHHVQVKSQEVFFNMSCNLCFWSVMDIWHSGGKTRSIIQQSCLYLRWCHETWACQALCVFTEKFHGGLYAFPCYCYVKENSMACIRQLCNSESHEANRRDISFRTAKERNILSLKLPLYGHWKHSAATQYLMYIFN